MARTFPYIIGPAEGHAHQGVKSAASYLAAQAKYLQINREAGVDDAVPHEATERERAKASAPFINIGQWKMTCACGNAPSVSFEWDLACCWECGAIYRNLPCPREKARIELVLTQRDRRGRNWDLAETLSALIDENITHGDRVPDADELDEVSDGL